MHTSRALGHQPANHIMRIATLKHTGCSQAGNDVHTGNFDVGERHEHHFWLHTLLLVIIPITGGKCWLYDL